MAVPRGPIEKLTDSEIEKASPQDDTRPQDGGIHPDPGRKQSLPPERLQESLGSTPPPHPSTKQKKSVRFKLTILSLCIVSVAGSMDAVIVAACLSAMAEDLDGSSVETFWIGISFLLTQTVTIPIYGTLSNIFGRKWLIMSAVGLFLLGSILCATAQSMQWLIGARVVQGFGAGGTLNLVSVIISDITSLRERGTYLALGGLAWAIGTNIGVPLGGAIAEHTTWRWVFWINIPLCVIPMIGLWFTLNLETDSSSLLERLARIDYAGILVFSGASCAILVGITTGGTLYSWSSAPVLVPLFLGLALYATFMLYEWKVPKEPMIPLRVFNDRTATSAFFQSFIHGIVIWCFIYYMIIFFLGALQHGRFLSALETIPGGAYTAPTAIIAGLLVKRLLRFRLLIQIGWCLTTLGMGVTILMHPDSNNGVLYGLRIIASVGGGVLFPLPQLAAQVNQVGDDVGTATSLIVFFRSLGQAFGVAIGGVIFQNQWDREIARKVAIGNIPARFVVRSNQAEVAYGIIRQFPNDVQTEYQWVYSDSLGMVWVVMTVIAGLGLLASCLLRNESLDKGVQSRQTFQERANAQCQEGV